MRRIAFDCLPTGEANQPKHLHCFGIKLDAIFVRIIIADKPLRNINATNRPAFDRWGAAGSKRPLAFRAAKISIPTTCRSKYALQKRRPISGGVFVVRATALPQGGSVGSLRQASPAQVLVRARRIPFFCTAD